MGVERGRFGVRGGWNRRWIRPRIGGIGGCKAHCILTTVPGPGNLTQAT